MAVGMVCTSKWSTSSYPTSASSMEGNSVASIVSEDNVSVDCIVGRRLRCIRAEIRGLIPACTIFVVVLPVHAVSADCMPVSQAGVMQP